MKRRPGDVRVKDEIDALTLEINKADALTNLIQERLEALAPDGGGELYALSLVAYEVSNKLQLILEGALGLYHGSKVKWVLSMPTASGAAGAERDRENVGAR